MLREIMCFHACLGLVVLISNIVLCLWKTQRALALLDSRYISVKPESFADLCMTEWRGNSGNVFLSLKIK